jgi:hypothetical protein
MLPAIAICIDVCSWTYGDQASWLMRLTACAKVATVPKMCSTAENDEVALGISP